MDLQSKMIKKLDIGTYLLVEAPWGGSLGFRFLEGVKKKVNEEGSRMTLVLHRICCSGFGTVFFHPLLGIGFTMCAIHAKRP